MPEKQAPAPEATEVVSRERALREQIEKIERESGAKAIAVAMRDGPAAGLAVMDEVIARGSLSDYRFAHAARADMYRRLGRVDEARSAYAQALALTQQEAERRYIARRMADLG